AKTTGPARTPRLASGRDAPADNQGFSERCSRRPPLLRSGAIQREDRFARLPSESAAQSLSRPRAESIRKTSDAVLRVARTRAPAGSVLTNCRNLLGRTSGLL